MLLCAVHCWMWTLLQQVCVSCRGVVLKTEQQRDMQRCHWRGSLVKSYLPFCDGIWNLTYSLDIHVTHITAETCACTLILFFSLSLICGWDYLHLKYWILFWCKWCSSGHGPTPWQSYCWTKKAEFPPFLCVPEPTYQFNNQPASEAAMGYMRTRSCFWHD